jgi:hypothetical protein
MDAFNLDPGSRTMMSAERVDHLPARIGDILVALHRGYGIDGRGPDEESVAYGQMMLGELLKDLDIDLPAMGVEVIDTHWKFDDLPKYSLIAIPAIASAPNLTHEQKTRLLAHYPELITGSGFKWTYSGGKSVVRKKLQTVKRGSPVAKVEHERLIKDVERTWRQERVQRIVGFTGSLVASLKK